MPSGRKPLGSATVRAGRGWESRSPPRAVAGEVPESTRANDASTVVVAITSRRAAYGVAMLHRCQEKRFREGLFPVNRARGAPPASHRLGTSWRTPLAP